MEGGSDDMVEHGDGGRARIGGTLAVNKSSVKIGKGMRKCVVQPKPVPPRVYNTDPTSFRNLVQELTGTAVPALPLSSSSSASSSSSLSLPSSSLSSSSSSFSSLSSASSSSSSSSLSSSSFASLSSSSFSSSLLSLASSSSSPSYSSWPPPSSSPSPSSSSLFLSASSLSPSFSSLSAFSSSSSPSISSWSSISSAPSFSCSSSSSFPFAPSSSSSSPSSSSFSFSSSSSPSSLSLSSSSPSSSLSSVSKPPATRLQKIAPAPLKAFSHAGLSKKALPPVSPKSTKLNSDSLGTAVSASPKMLSPIPILSPHTFSPSRTLTPFDSMWPNPLDSPDTVALIRLAEKMVENENASPNVNPCPDSTSSFPWYPYMQACFSPGSGLAIAQPHAFGNLYAGVNDSPSSHSMKDFSFPNPDYVSGFS